jgi:hypothetical protein
MALALAGWNIVRAGVLLAGVAISSTIAVTPVLAQDYSAIIASSDRSDADRQTDSGGIRYTF